MGNMYPPLHEGGYEQVWCDAVRLMRGHGHTLTVLTTDHRRDEAPATEDGVFRDLRWYWKAHEWPRMNPFERLALERHNARVFEERLDRDRPDVVGWWSMGGMSLSLIERTWRRRIPSAAIVCEDWMLYGPQVDAWTRMFTRRPRAAAVVDRVTGIPTVPDLAHAGAALFPSEATRDGALSRWKLTHTTVCNQGVSSELFPRRPTAEWGWRLLYVGRLDERKGVDLAIQALALLPESATLVIAGVGEEAYASSLRGLAERLGVQARVTFTTRPREELVELYEAANVLVFPTRWEEPWGLVPLEAMSVGRPVVATGRGGSGEYLKDGQNSVLFDVEEGGNGLAEAIRALARDGALRERVVAGGIATAGERDEDTFSQAAEGVLQSALDAS